MMICICPHIVDQELDLSVVVNGLADVPSSEVLSEMQVTAEVYPHVKTHMAPRNTDTTKVRRYLGGSRLESLY